MLDGKAIKTTDAIQSIERMMNIVTADAMHCQKETAEKIIENNMFKNNKLKKMQITRWHTFV